MKNEKDIRIKDVGEHYEVQIKKRNIFFIKVWKPLYYNESLIECRRIADKLRVRN